MKFGYVSNGLADHRIEDALELLAENGYSGVALTLDHIHFDPFAPRLRARAARLRAELEAAGLECVVETGARFVLDPRRKHFPTLLERRPVAPGRPAVHGGRCRGRAGRAGRLHVVGGRARQARRRSAPGTCSSTAASGCSRMPIATA